ARAARRPRDGPRAVAPAPPRLDRRGVRSLDRCRGVPPPPQARGRSAQPQDAQDHPRRRLHADPGGRMNEALRTGRATGPVPLLPRRFRSLASRLVVLGLVQLVLLAVTAVVIFVAE